jgi:hypothetical protein
MDIYALVGLITFSVLVVMVTAYFLVKSLLKFKNEQFIKLSNGFAKFVCEDYMKASEEVTVDTLKCLMTELTTTMKSLMETYNV